jgi:hypothetical protein
MASRRGAFMIAAMSIAAVKPIVPVATLVAELAVVELAVESVSRIEGTITRIDRRGKHLFTFEGTGLRKAGRGEVAVVIHEGTTYRGDLIAIAPKRAILHISNSRSDHGIVKA